MYSLFRSVVVNCFLLFSFYNTLQAAEYRIKSARELSSLSLNPGDKVILLDGNWENQQLVFKGNGTERLPIEMKAEHPGRVMFSGNSNLKIDGSWLIVDGLLFQNGYSLKEDVVLFTNNASNSRFTNSAILDFNHPDKKVDYKWISLNGSHNRVDHCYIKGKSHQGTTLVVWLSDKPNFHRIDHNYFVDRPELGGNGGETIRVGTSTWSMHDSFTTIENNVFYHCDGEIEAISNKSCKNTIRNNLFYECKATLTLRHGNNAEVYGNVFMGNNKPGTGGIRIIGENHKVHDNYLQDLTGTGLSAAISVMAGLPNPELTSHWQVKNATINDNTIVNCKESFAIGAGYNTERYLPAINTVFSDNIIVTKGAPLKWYDEKVNITFKNNLVSNTMGGHNLPDGFTLKEMPIRKDQYGLYEIAGKKQPQPFWKTDKIGTSWMNIEKELKL